MKIGWAGHEHKPAESILKKYQSYIIPYSEITGMETGRTGRVLRTSRLTVHTPKGVYTFMFHRVRLYEIEDEIRRLFPEAHPSLVTDKRDEQ